MDKHRIRNLIPPIYAALTVIGFFVSAAVGTIVLIVGAIVSGALWSAFSGGPGGSGPRVDRAAARAARRQGRR